MRKVGRRHPCGPPADRVSPCYRWMFGPDWVVQFRIHCLELATHSSNWYIQNPVVDHKYVHHNWIAWPIITESEFTLVHSHIIFSSNSIPHLMNPDAKWKTTLMDRYGYFDLTYFFNAPTSSWKVCPKMGLRVVPHYRGSNFKDICWNVSKYSCKDLWRTICRFLYNTAFLHECFNV